MKRACKSFFALAKWHFLLYLPLKMLSKARWELLSYSLRLKITAPFQFPMITLMIEPENRRTQGYQRYARYSPWCKCSTYSVQHVSPALERNTLEDSEHWQTEVVEVCNPVVGSLPVESAHLGIGAVVAQLPTGMGVVHHFSCVNNQTYITDWTSKNISP